MNKKSNIIVGIAIIAVIGLSAFGFSLASKEGKGTEAIKSPEIQKSAVIAPVKTVSPDLNASSTSGEGEFVASKSGSKYFPVNCGSAKTIKEENKVFFGSASEAESAGYTLAKNCK